MVCAFTANREGDPDDELEEFDIAAERDDRKLRPLFGAGIHYALGVGQTSRAPSSRRRSRSSRRGCAG